MSLVKPENMDEVIYFTRRATDDGKIVAWVYKKDCEECGKAKMGKPVVKGKVKIRAKEYVCPACNHTVEKNEHEETLDIDIEYTCPHCKHEGEITTQYKRKSFKGAKAIVFECDKCNEKIPITKKMKATKE